MSSLTPRGTSSSKLCATPRSSPRKTLRKCPNTPTKKTPLHECSTMNCSSPTCKKKPNSIRKMRNPITDMKAHFQSQENVLKKKITPKRSYNGKISSPASANKKLCLQRDSGTNGSLDAGICVAVRIRPFSDREKAQHDLKCLASVHDCSVTISTESSTNYEFIYDKCFWSVDTDSNLFANQELVYNEIGKPLLDNTFQGYNTCLFAYGQTGSGKSFTVMGSEGEKAGIVPRFCEDLFDKIRYQDQLEFIVEFSYFEIYNEKIHDLLSQDDCHIKKKLKVREHPDNGPYVQGLSSIIVKCFKDVQMWLSVGNKRRATAATGMNEKSSRSHSVTTMIVTQIKKEIFEGTETQFTKRSRVNIIDLAGSEKAVYVTEDQTQGHEASNARLKEGSCINKSLHTLGKVIAVLSENGLHQKSRQSYIPYRDSILTWLLKDSLGGNSKTAIIATISPSAMHCGETLSTLRYASQARKIVNKAKINEDSNTKLIRDLLEEIERLKSSHGTGGHSLVNSNEVNVLKKKLDEMQNALAEGKRLWQEKAQHSMKPREIYENQTMEHERLVEVNNQMPSLVNLNEDPQLSEVLLYILKPGVSTIGHVSSDFESDIKLKGNLIMDHHCSIINSDCKTFFIPEDDCMTFINGYQIDCKTQIFHGDRIILGGDHFFRFNNPCEINHNEDTIRPIKRDYNYAKEEFVEAQNRKLEAEFRDAQIEVEEEFVRKMNSAKVTAEVELQCQRNMYEGQLDFLEKQLKKAETHLVNSEGKRVAIDEKLERVELHKKVFEDKVFESRKRLQEEATNTAQIIRQSEINHGKVIAELEKEKSKIETGIKKLKSSKVVRNNIRDGMRRVLNDCKKTQDKNDTDPSHDFIRILLRLREANTLSQKFKKNMVFTRDDVINDDKTDFHIRINKTDCGLSACVTLDVFEYALIRMRDFTADDEEETDDPFSFSDCEWKQDFQFDQDESAVIITRSSRLSVGRRRSLALLASLNTSIAEQKLERTFTVPRPSMSASLSATLIEEENSHSFTIKDTEPAICDQTKSIESNQFEKFHTAKPNSLNFLSSYMDNCATNSKDISAHSNILRTISYLKSSLVTLKTSSQPNNVDFLVEWTVLLHAQCHTFAGIMISFDAKIVIGLTRELCCHADEILQTVKTGSQSVFSAQQSKMQDSIDQLSSLLLSFTTCFARLILFIDDRSSADSTQQIFESKFPCELINEFVLSQRELLLQLTYSCITETQMSLEPIKELQINCEHLVSMDCVDGVVNVLVSASTFLDAASVFIDKLDMCNLKAITYTMDVCSVLRSIVSNLLLLKELFEQICKELQEASQHIDSLDDVGCSANEIAETTKSFVEDLIHLTGLTRYVVSNEDKIQFCSKALRISCTIVIGDIQNQLRSYGCRSSVGSIENQETSIQETSRTSLVKLADAAKSRRRSIFGRKRNSLITSSVVIKE